MLLYTIILVVIIVIIALELQYGERRCLQGMLKVWRGHLDRATHQEQMRDSYGWAHQGTNGTKGTIMLAHTHITVGLSIRLRFCCCGYYHNTGTRRSDIFEGAVAFFTTCGRIYSSGVTLIKF